MRYSDPKIIPGRRPDRLRHRALVAGSALVTTIAVIVGSPGSQAAPSPRDPDRSPASQARGTDKALQSYDTRTTGASGRALQRREQQLAADPAPAVTRLHTKLGVQGVISIDPLTRTPRAVARLDGYLTGPSSRQPAAIVHDYVAANPGVFGLDAADLATLRLRKTYTDIAGIRHLSWVQYAGQVPVFGNGLRANVARDGRLLSVAGSPVSDVRAVSASPTLSAAKARSTAIKDVDGKVVAAKETRSAGASRPTTFSDGDRASLVAFQSTAGSRLAWQTIVSPPGGKMFVHVVDAATGRVLLRQNLTVSDTGSVWDYWPGKPVGGRQHVVDLTRPGWLPGGSTRLVGNNAHVWSDVNDDNLAQGAEEVAPGAASFQFSFVDFSRRLGTPCSSVFRCSWDPGTPFSWQVNRKQDAVQVFYFVNTFHDHLKAAPIGFTRAAGNFEAVDGDPVLAQSDDGADTGTGDLAGLPDSNHTDNANMGTPPDGTSPEMQMYLFPDPAIPDDPFLASNGGDDADIVYHEYTHGLSNRLVVDASGNSTLLGPQAGAMGEAWSDWYAMDFLNDQGLQRDTRAPGEVQLGTYLGVGQNLVRTQPLDCPVGTTSARCPGTPDVGAGGYTYGDFGKIIGGPEVHADGEIWGETLWDLRAVLGSRLTESLVTRAMELSPANPTYLDMRNSILQADTATNGGRARTTIWRVFAHRGMGYFAGAVNGDDTAPVEDFSLPPRANAPRGSLSGAVTNDSGVPLAGATVAFGGHASGFANDYVDTTDARGRYRISGIFAGRYPDVFAQSPGYDRVVRTLRVNAGANRADWALRRDWASLGGGASVTDTNGDEFADFGCGAAALFDQSANGWSASRELGGTTVTPKFVVVKLPSAVDVSEIAIDPSATCGDGASASTGPYQLETSVDGVTWTPASSGTFTPADVGHFSSPALAAGSTAGVQFVRYTMRDSQVLQLGTCPGAFSGCDFIDSSELEVYGTPAG